MPELEAAKFCNKKAGASAEAIADVLRTETDLVSPSSTPLSLYQIDRPAPPWTARGGRVAQPLRSI